MKSEIHETSLNDVWSRRAALAIEPEPKPRVPLKPGETKPKPGSAMAVAGLTPEKVKKLAVKFSNAPVKPNDKEGPRAAQLNNVVSVWIEITPEMADRWLKVNFRNRPMSDEVVKAYARDMAAGRWQPTHQGIGFNDLDQLIDGQHRLAAILLYGRPVRMMVTFGLASKIDGTEMTTMDCVDRGRTRTVADQLKIQHGLKEGSQIAGIAASLAHLCVGERMRRLSVGQTLDTYRAFQGGVDYVVKYRSRTGGLKSAAVLAAFAFAYDVKGADVKLRFARLNTGEELDQSPPLKALREFLLANESVVMMRKMHRGIVELVVHAIWLDMFKPGNPLSMELSDWQTAVEYFRGKQEERVEKIAALFKLEEKL